MEWLSWTLWSSAALLGAMALVIVYRSLFHDRARGNKRCPRCWYDMNASSALRCPECGHEARSADGLRRTRRRYRRVAGGLLLAALACVVWITPRAVQQGSA